MPRQDTIEHTVDAEHGHFQTEQEAADAAAQAAREIWREINETSSHNPTPQDFQTLRIGGVTRRC